MNHVGIGDDQPGPKLSSQHLVFSSSSALSISGPPHHHVLIIINIILLRFILKMICTSNGKPFRPERTSYHDAEHDTSSSAFLSGFFCFLFSKIISPVVRRHGFRTKLPLASV